MLDPSNHPEILSAAEMRAADAAAIAAGTPGIVLMERAGKAVADEAERMARTATRIVVLCGPGNNGGDGFVAARLLARRGWRVELGLLGERAELRGDAQLASDGYAGPVSAAGALALKGAGLIVDALFGAGLSRALDGQARALVEAIGASGAPVLSVDMPSGLDTDTGEIMGVAPQATRTVTFHRLKPCHVLLPGSALCGDVRLRDIGLSAFGLGHMRLIGPDDFRRAQRPRAPQDHKYARGAALVLSGAAHRTGAARLAAQAALRVGAGVVAIAAEGASVAANSAHVTAIMVEPFDGLSGFARLIEDERRTAVVIGPGAGVGEPTRGYVRAALARTCAVVIDADALTSFAGQLDDLAAHIAAQGGQAVLTPHDGEFRRLFGDARDVRAARGKIERARAAARACRGVVLCKGADTVIAAPDGRVGIAWRSPASLATAGSGDVLAGLIGGLMAQGAPPFEAACAAAWAHARCAERLGEGVIAEDLAVQIGPVITALNQRNVKFAIH